MLQSQTFAFDSGVPEFNLAGYIQQKKMSHSENPEEEGRSQEPFQNYMADLHHDDPILNCQSFSIQADRDYNLSMFHKKEMQLAMEEEKQTE